MKQVQHGNHIDALAHERSPYLCKELINEEIINAIENDEGNSKALCHAIGRYAERVYEYRTEYVMASLQGLDSKALYDLYIKKGALYDHVKSRGIDTESGTPSLIVLTNETMYRAAGDDKIMKPNETYNLKSHPKALGKKPEPNSPTHYQDLLKNTAQTKPRG
jgi:hypothetical protein